MPSLRVNQKFAGKFAVERFLGEGAFAEVYRVHHRFMGRQAVKVFKAPAQSIEEVHTWLDEARTLSALRHPNIVQVFEADAIKGPRGFTGYFSMEYATGGTLDRFWRSYGFRLMPVAEVVEVTRQVCRALAVAHNLNPPIIHRDIKPQNILISLRPHGINAALSDFGLAKRVNAMTLLLSCRGTIGYKAPESFATSMDSPRSDIWAIGTMVYLMLTDQMPYPGLDERDIEDASRFLRPLRPPSLFNIGVDGGLESIVYRCLAADPADRYSNAEDLLSDLERWTPTADGGQSSLSTSDPGATPKSTSPARSHHDLRTEAQAALQQAIQLARDPRLLASSAADLLEEAISKDPSLREEHESRLHWWRRGISDGVASIEHSSDLGASAKS
jgi:serine/threonine protein kinase